MLRSLALGSLLTASCSLITLFVGSALGACQSYPEQCTNVCEFGDCDNSKCFCTGSDCNCEGQIISPATKFCLCVD